MDRRAIKPNTFLKPDSWLWLQERERNHPLRHNASPPCIYIVEALNPLSFLVFGGFYISLTSNNLISSLERFDPAGLLNFSYICLLHFLLSPVLVSSSPTQMLLYLFHLDERLLPRDDGTYITSSPFPGTRLKGVIYKTPSNLNDWSIADDFQKRL